MAIIRPPGHHAMKAEYNGYCFFNNVAIAAQHALNNRGVSNSFRLQFGFHKSLIDYASKNLDRSHSHCRFRCSPWPRDPANVLR